MEENQKLIFSLLFKNLGCFTDVTWQSRDQLKKPSRVFKTKY